MKGVTTYNEVADELVAEFVGQRGISASDAVSSLNSVLCDVTLIHVESSNPTVCLFCVWLINISTVIFCLKSNWQLEHRVKLESSSSRGKDSRRWNVIFYLRPQPASRLGSSMYLSKNCPQKYTPELCSVVLTAHSLFVLLLLRGGRVIVCVCT